MQRQIIRSLLLCLIVSAVGACSTPASETSREQMLKDWHAVRNQPIAAYLSPTRAMWEWPEKNPDQSDAVLPPAPLVRHDYGPYSLIGLERTQPGYVVLYQRSRPLWSGTAIIPMGKDSLLLLSPVESTSHNMLHDVSWLDYAQEPHTLQELGQLWIPYAFVNQCPWVIDIDNDGRSELVALQSDSPQALEAVGQRPKWFFVVYEQREGPDDSIMLLNNPRQVSTRYHLNEVIRSPLPRGVLLQSVALEALDPGHALTARFSGSDEPALIGVLKKNVQVEWRFEKE